MAFDSVPGIKVICPQTEYSYIFADYFSVFERTNEAPIIYSWHEVKAVTENKDSFIISVKSKTYNIYKKAFLNNQDILRARAIIEGEVATYENIAFKPGKRVLPAKYLYRTCPIPENSYYGNGIYTEQEINSGSVAIMNARMWHALWIIGIICAAVAFFLLHSIVGKTGENWFYYLPISAFSGFIISILIYLICSIVAKFKYTELYRIDPATVEDITFIICKDGFAAVESFIYTGSDLIPWSQASYFVETNFAFIVMNTSKAIFWLPKRIFEKSLVNEISTFLLARMPQK